MKTAFKDRTSRLQVWKMLKLRLGLTYRCKTLNQNTTSLAVMLESTPLYSMKKRSVHKFVMPILYKPTKLISISHHYFECFNSWSLTSNYRYGFYAELWLSWYLLQKKLLVLESWIFWYTVIYLWTHHTVMYSYQSSTVPLFNILHLESRF